MTLPVTKPQLGSTGWHPAIWNLIDVVNGLDERIRDTLAAAFVAGVGLDLTVNDAGDTITIDLTGGTSGSPTSLETVYRRGVNLAGGEFAADAAHLPGTYGTDYSYDNATALLAMASRGHKIIRLPLRWERIQPTRGAALSSAELTRLQSFVSDAAAAGLKVVFDVHNYARYFISGGSELVLGDGSLTQAQLVDLWTRLSVAFAGNPGVYAYGLMNEPHDLPAVVGSFSGTVRYDWNDGTVQGWTGDGASVSNVSNKLRFALTPGSTGFYQTRKDDAGSSPSNTDPVLEATVTLAAGTPGTWEVLLQWQNASFAWQTAGSTTYKRVDTGAVVSGLIAGVAVKVRATHATIPSGRPFAIQIQCNSPTVGTYSADVDDFSQGTVTGSLTSAQVWEVASQACVSAIRGNGDTTKIMVPGYGWSSAKDWVINHAAPWILDSINNFSYEAHYYFDVDNSGDYPDSYATENSAAITAGYSSLADRAVDELNNFTAWCDTFNVPGFIGEIGWPNNADTSSWNAVGEALYSLLDSNNMDVTYWAAGARWGTGYNLSAYTGTNQDVSKAPATTIEMHPSFDFQLTLANLDDRYLGSGGTGGGGTGPQGPPGMVWRGTWSGATTYAVNDAVTYNGSAFITTAGVTGTTPGTPSAPNSPWQLLAGLRPGGVVALTDGATISVNADTTDTGKVTLGGNRTMAAPSGTPLGGQRLVLRIKQDGTGSRTMTWNAAYRFSGGTAPTLTTAASKTDYLGFIYNADDSKWDCVAVKLGF